MSESMHEQNPLEHAPQEKILSMHRDDLRPEVKAYAENLAAQVRTIIADNGLTELDELIDAVSAGKISKKVLDEIERPLQMLEQVAKKGEFSEATEKARATAQFLIAEALYVANSNEDPYSSAQDRLDAAELCALNKIPLTFRRGSVFVFASLGMFPPGKQWQVDSIQNRLAEVLTKLGRAEEAKELAKDLPDNKRDTRYGHIALSFAETGNTEEAKKMLRALSDQAFLKEWLTDVVERAVYGGHADTAMELIAMTDDAETLAHGYALIAEQQFYDEQDYSEALEKCIENAGRMPFGSKGDIARRRAAQALARTDNIERARSTADLISSIKERARARVTIAEARLRKKDDPERGLKELRDVLISMTASMTDADDRESVMADYVRLLAKNQDFEKAKEQVKVIADENHRKKAYVAMAREYARNDKIEEALDLCNDAQHAAEEIIYAAARGYATKHKGDIMAFLPKVTDFLLSRTSLSLSQTMRQLARLDIFAGRFDVAAKQIDQINDPDVRLKTKMELARAETYAKGEYSSFFDEAHDTAVTLGDKKNETLHSLAATELEAAKALLKFAKKGRLVKPFWILRTV